MKNYLTVSKYTFIEIYRSKLMLSLLFIAIGLVTLCYVAASFGYGAPEKIALDVGLGVIGISNVVISILLGATLIGKEIEQRTLYMILSKPISRTSFLMGKITGLSTVLFMNTVLLGLLSLGLYVFLGGKFAPLIVWTWWFSFVEAVIVLLFAVMFSLVTNTTITILNTVVVYVVGHSLNEVSKTVFAKMSSFNAFLLDSASYFIPNLYRLNLKDHVIYKQTLPLDFLMLNQAYATSYLMALILAVVIIFNNKNLD